MAGSSNRPAKPIKATIETLRRHYGLGSPSSVAVISERWSALASEAVADHSTVVDLRSGVLSIDAYDPATAEALKWSRQGILAGVREACPDEEIADISVRVRRRPSARDASGRPGTDPR